METGDAAARSLSSGIRRPMLVVCAPAQANTGKRPLITSLTLRCREISPRAPGSQPMKMGPADDSPQWGPMRPGPGNFSRNVLHYALDRSWRTRRDRAPNTRPRPRPRLAGPHRKPSPQQLGGTVDASSRAPGSLQDGPAGAAADDDGRGAERPLSARGHGDAPPRRSRLERGLQALGGPAQARRHHQGGARADALAPPDERVPAHERADRAPSGAPRRRQDVHDELNLQRDGIPRGRLPHHAHRGRGHFSRLQRLHPHRHRHPRPHRSGRGLRRLPPRHQGGPQG